MGKRKKNKSNKNNNKTKKKPSRTPDNKRFGTKLG